MLAEQCQVCASFGSAGKVHSTTHMCMLACSTCTAMFFANGSMLVTSWSVDAHGASATFTDSVGGSVGTRDCVPSLVRYAQVLCVQQW